MEWCRLYAVWGSDPKVQTLSEADQRRHIMLLTLQCQGDLPSMDDEAISFYMRISPKDWENTKRRLVGKGLIAENGNGNIELPAWSRRQPKWDHSSERVRKWRKEHTCPDCQTLDKDVLLGSDGKMVYCPICLPKK